MRRGGKPAKSNVEAKLAPADKSRKDDGRRLWPSGRATHVAPSLRGLTGNEGLFCFIEASAPGHAF